MREDNKEKENFNKSKYLLMGFIIGIIPFIIIMLICSNVSGSIDTMPKIFKNTIIILGIITSITNAFIFKTMMLAKIKEFSK